MAELVTKVEPVEEAAPRLKLGLALSGGGFRTALFHLGVLTRLAEHRILGRVESISTVSGGSIVGAALYLRMLHAHRDPDQRLDDETLQRIVTDLAREFVPAVERNVRMLALAKWRPLVRMAAPDYSRSDRVAEIYEELFFQGLLEGANRPIMMRELDAGEPGAPRDGRMPRFMINATSLNSGRNWRFSPTTMGEPPRRPEVYDLDKATRFEAPDRYEDLAEHPRDIPLSVAVAASSALPGGLHPMSISEMYPAHRIQLTDGGVHDNQGVQALIDDECSHALVSDTGGQLLTQEHPSPSLLRVLLRTSGILYGRVRQEQLFRLMERPRREGFPAPLGLVHLRRGVPVMLRHYARPEPSEDEVRVPTDGSSSDFGVHPDAMELLAELRTDLDSFSELESLALIGAAYRITGDVLTRSGWVGMTGADGPLPPATDQVPRLDAIGDVLANAPKEFRRHMKIGRSRFFKSLMVYRWPWWLTIAAVLAGLGAAVWAVFRNRSMEVSVGSIAVVIGVIVVLVLIQAVTLVARFADWGPIVVLKAIRNGIVGLFMIAWARFYLAVFNPLFLRAGRLDAMRRSS
jgi:predicted acylesterase/phospholipase RssA